MQDCSICARRRFLWQATAGSAAFFTTSGAFAEELIRTAAQGEGPFYPDKLPLDTDNDLLLINDSITPAVGEITHLTGTVKDVKGKPIRNALVKIWQCDATGIYIHSKGGSREKRDSRPPAFSCPHHLRPRRARGRPSAVRCRFHASAACRCQKIQSPSSHARLFRINSLKQVAGW